MTPQVTVLLPTIRPHLVSRAIDSIRHAAQSVSYEVVVVADFPAEVLGCCSPVGHLHVNWIRHERNGVVDAVKVACEMAQGEFWFLFNDESVLEPQALDLLHAEALRTPGEILAPKHLPAFPFTYYGLPFAPFMFVHRDLVRQLGGLLDTRYRGFYADPDFSLRAHAAGIPIREVSGAVLRHANKHDAPHHAAVDAYLAADRASFRARWDHLGEFRDP